MMFAREGMWLADDCEAGAECISCMPPYGDPVGSRRGSACELSVKQALGWFVNSSRVNEK